MPELDAQEHESASGSSRFNIASVRGRSDDPEYRADKTALNTRELAASRGLDNLLRGYCGPSRANFRQSGIQPSCESGSEQLAR
jgi:hypothetical protein